MKKTTLLLFMLFFESAFSQKTLAKYPDGQFPYQGGSLQLFSDMQNYFLKSGSKPCDKNEMYFVSLKIDENGKPALVKKKSDDPIIEKNKCAFSLAVKSLGSLKNWQPAEQNGQKVAAYFDFLFQPKDFFENYKPDYDIVKSYQSASMPGGMKAFRKDVLESLSNYLDWESYNPKGTFLISFAIDENGDITNVDLEPKVENNKILLEDVKFALKKIKGKWSPAKTNGTSVKSWFRMPINFNSRE
ncbi:hypothetical protein [Chryseobacterium sp.]|uniref:hypothetical protein n=1 Tax=Chryseobacterium sp. TaxID=1871047 RepID=UPI001B1B47C3|nr:hypothetical protein [Chryseobacterium sp.]MBO9691222.1 hypothetical protein [Chryseobacterium sp.]